MFLGRVAGSVTTPGQEVPSHGRSELQKNQPVPSLMYTQMNNPLCVAVIDTSVTNNIVCNKKIDLLMKPNPITRFTPQKLFWVVWDMDLSGFGILT